MNKNEKILFFSGKLTKEDDLNKIAKNIATQIVDMSGYGFFCRDKIWYRVQLKNNFSFIDAKTGMSCRLRTKKIDSVSSEEIEFSKNL